MIIVGVATADLPGLLRRTHILRFHWMPVALTQVRYDRFVVALAHNDISKAQKYTYLLAYR
jgi:hypothetical protein